MSPIESYPLHGGQLTQIAERFDIPVSELMDFSANINPDGPPPSVLATLRASLDNLSILTEYPDLEEIQLKQAIARYAGVSVHNLAVANGFVPLLDAVLSVLNIRRCLLPIPAFVEYRNSLERAGVELVPHVLSADSSFRYEPAAMLADRHDAILLANPQNPSGVCHDAAVIRDLVISASKKNIYVLLDEAFIDYAPDHSLTAAVDEFPNLIVFRSVTKFHGIPGLRVAYAAASHELAASINKSLPPWPITTLAALAVSAALEDSSYASRSRSENLARRTALHCELATLGLIVYPSAANFLLFELLPGIDTNAFWQHMIVNHRMVLRACTNYEALPDRHFRVAVRTRAENSQLAAAVAESIFTT